MTAKLVIIDGHAILHRAYHALPPLTTSKGKQVNAVFGFVSMLLRIIDVLKPTHLAVAFDRPKPTFRKKMYKDYQATRPEMDKELVSQIGLVHKVVDMMEIPSYEIDGYEADDVIATLAKRASLENKIYKEIIIVTGDRDLLQLVDEHIKLYMPVKGLSKSKIYGEREVEEKFGVRPSQIVDYKALVGDQSDNYPGVSGVGPKTANMLLSRFSTLEEVYQNLDKVKTERLRENLRKSRESAEMAKKLATIVYNVPIKIDLEKCRLKNLDKPSTRQFFEEMEFRSLIPRLSLWSKRQPINNKEQRKKKGNGQKNKSGQISLF